MKHIRLNKVCLALVALTLLLTVCFALVACKQEPIGTEGLEYALNDDGESYSVIGIGTATQTDLVIPTLCANKPVTAIASEAFSGCSKITSVIIPDSVTSIGARAFDSCSSLQLNEYGNALYLGNNDNPYLFLLQSKDWFINSCEVHEQTKVIADYAFSNNNELKSVTIGNKLTTIGKNAFEYCMGLTDVTIPDSVTTIDDYAFNFCRNLTSVTMGNSVASIGNGAFNCCSSLNSVVIPDSVTSIGANVFYGCSSLADIAVDEANDVYHSAGNCLIETATKTLIAGSNSSVIPADGSVMVIDEFAFAGSKITSIVIPDSVQEIRANAFYYCSGLISVTIGNGVTRICDNAFEGCYELISAEIGSSVTSIGRAAFLYCNSLTEIKYNGTVAQWNAVEKDDTWNLGGVPATKVICTDGEVEL